jgi:restriction system protein
LVVDDVGSKFRLSAADALATASSFRTNGQFIVTSRLPAPDRGIDCHMNLSGLAPADVREFLGAIGAPDSLKEVASELSRYARGNYVMMQAITDLLTQISTNPVEVLARLEAFSAPGIVDVHGNPLSSTSTEHQELVTDVRTVTDELLRTLAADPRLLYELAPRRFEELVAELLGRLGYQVTLTSMSRDGGKDIYAAKKDPLGTFLYIVECKKYSPERKVGIAIVQRLNGVVRAENATAGVLATTSFFTKDAKAFQKTIASQMSLKDYLGIREWLDAVIGRK